ncbi:protein-disulfide reductase DsbD [Acinetobacter bohemicus]|nr:protein-disulfide reductase DsbD [Acinetobacter sp. S4400-12]MCO8042005.1 protein-disulfide reductase DsbD [Acinetobacter sp. S4400-12]MCU7224098.1 protein-disulfide reductase DsbD [Acinetobacter bohemicus]
MAWICRVFWIMVCIGLNNAYADYLPPDQAFQFQAVSTSQDKAELTWKIADGYYLYHDQLKVSQGQTPLKLNLPAPQDKDDPNFGLTPVHYGQVKTQIKVQPQQTLSIQWQGCAESGLCYPVQRSTLQTDAEGLLPAQRITETKKLLNLDSTANAVLQPEPAVEPGLAQEKKPAPAVENLSNKDIEEISEIPVLLPQTEPVADKTLTPAASEISPQTELQTPADQATSPMQSQWNNDQFFFSLLSSQNLLINLLVFLGLGILLAFLPCSLPLIPILSGILVQRKTGYRAALIAGAFVVGMAIVYALMGLAVAQLGYSFQRWFQSPAFIGFFALLFVLFAFNLFGAFQLSLPQGLLQRLDQWQQRQKGGTLFGAFLMGVIAALIVGPCMSAPLAGALLFVSQLNQPVMGASYLFVLGLGLGLPIFIASVFGAKYLPKPGVWMDRLKFSFGFVMLALAIYFIRPFIPGVVYFSLLGLTLLLLAGYCLLKMLPHLSRAIPKTIVAVLSLLFAAGGIWQLNQAVAQLNITQAERVLEWQKVSTAEELSRVLVQSQGQAVIIDVYADWCVACQPIEHEVLPREDVQMALQDIVRIKLDLTHYHPSQDEILKQWQILGPPTMIMLDASQQEQRRLRLTGTFSAEQLLTRLKQLQVGGQP